MGFYVVGFQLPSLGAAFTNILKATDKMGWHFHPARASRKEITAPIGTIIRKS